jgi:CRISPR-associated protein (Cas_Cas2CT1978)
MSRFQGTGTVHEPAAVQSPGGRCCGSVPGVFVGRTTPAVADRLWARTSGGLDSGAMAMIVTDPNREQGYAFRMAGIDPPKVADLDGLRFIATRYAGTAFDPNLSLSEKSNETEQES